jgi:hypothetical protein
VHDAVCISFNSPEIEVGLLGREFVRVVRAFCCCRRAPRRAATSGRHRPGLDLLLHPSWRSVEGYLADAIHAAVGCNLGRLAGGWELGVLPARRRCAVVVRRDPPLSSVVDCTQPKLEAQAPSSRVPPLPPSCPHHLPPAPTRRVTARHRPQNQLRTRAAPFRAVAELLHLLVSSRLYDSFGRPLLSTITRESLSFRLAVETCTTGARRVSNRRRMRWGRAGGRRES